MQDIANTCARHNPCHDRRPTLRQLRRLPDPVAVADAHRSSARPATVKFSPNCRREVVTTQLGLPVPVGVDLVQHRPGAPGRAQPDHPPHGKDWEQGPSRVRVAIQAKREREALPRGSSSQRCGLSPSLSSWAELVVVGSSCGMGARPRQGRRHRPDNGQGGLSKWWRGIT
jgi:hypothetical protein